MKVNKKKSVNYKKKLKSRPNNTPNSQYQPKEQKPAKGVPAPKAYVQHDENQENKSEQRFGK